MTDLHGLVVLYVGMERFELSTSSSRTTRANLAALHPESIVGVSVGANIVNLKGITWDRRREQ